jgi:hypothetical protein
MSVYSYLLTILGIFFWIFRAVVTALNTSGVDFLVQPLNVTWEIVVIFVTIPCMIFVLKRNIVGAACYMGVYISYFGTALYDSYNNIAEGFTIGNSLDFIMAVIGCVIPLLTFLDILLNKNRKAIVSGKKSTDWYYNTDKYERQYDSRADRNQYKIK